MTVLEAINKGTEFLQRKGVDSPRLQSELLLAHVLNLPRLRLYLDFERQLTEAQSGALRELLTQRGNRIPLQHLIGSTSFCGCPIKVSPAVLIPRPETEILAEETWTFLKSLDRDTTFLDLGSGSGCIAIAIAVHVPNTRGLALELSSEAIAIAQQNITTDRIELRQSDLFSALKPGEQFDAIVSNPPYIPTAELQTLQPEVRDHDPRPALDGGPDGLDFYRAIAIQASLFLRQDGRLFLEFGDGQSKSLTELFTTAGWKIEKIIRDLCKTERVLIASR
jgi:release factor glutamine methyltransferase